MADEEPAAAVARHHLVAERALRPAAVVPADRVRKRRRARRGGAARAGLGEPRRLLLRVLLAHRAVDPARVDRSVVRPAGVGQQRADDVLLPGRRAWRRGASSTSATCASGGASCCRSPSGWSGMAVPALIFLAFNAGRDSAQAWGIAMSTDTALALGLLALIGRRGARPGAGVPGDRVRGGRPGRAGGDRDRLQRRHHPAAVAGRGRRLRRAARRGAAADAAALAVLRCSAS